MVKNKPPNLNKQQEQATEIYASISPQDALEPNELNHSQVVKEVKSKISELLKERKKQRAELLNVIKWLTKSSFSLLAVVVLFQAIVRLAKPDYEVLNDTAFNILAISVFGQVMGVIVIIVKSLWDDSEYIKKM